VRMAIGKTSVLPVFPSRKIKSNLKVTN